MWDKIGAMISGQAGDLLRGVKDLIGEFHVSPEEEQAFVIKAKELTQTYELKLMELQREVDRLEAADRDSARKREMEVKDHTNANLAYTVTGVMMGGLIYFNIYTPEPETKAIVENVMMAVRDGWLVILAYYFGSSRGSAAKHDMIERLVK